MDKHLKSNLLVSLQFILIGLLLSTTSMHEFSIVSGLFIFAAIALAAWAITAMQKSKIRLSPIPASDALLIVTGPYKYIRHPMYTSVLLGISGLLFIHFSWLRISMAIGLAIVLIIKLNWEEKMLVEKFTAYKDYIKNTKRIIPLLY